MSGAQISAHNSHCKGSETTKKRGRRPRWGLSAVRPPKGGKGTFVQQNKKPFHRHFKKKKKKKPPTRADRLKNYRANNRKSFKIAGRHRRTALGTGGVSDGRREFSWGAKRGLLLDPIRQRTAGQTKAQPDFLFFLWRNRIEGKKRPPRGLDLLEVSKGGPWGGEKGSWAGADRTGIFSFCCLQFSAGLSRGLRNDIFGLPNPFFVYGQKRPCSTAIVEAAQTSS